MLNRHSHDVSYVSLFNVPEVFTLKPWLVWPAKESNSESVLMLDRHSHDFSLQCARGVYTEIVVGSACERVSRHLVGLCSCSTAILMLSPTFLSPI